MTKRAVEDGTVADENPLLTDFGLYVRVIPGGALGNDVNIVGWFGSVAPTVGQKVMADSIPVVISSDQSPLSIALASEGLTGAAVPASAVQIGYADAAGLLRAARVHDLDTGAGTEFDLGVNLRRSGAGGSVELLAQQTMALSVPVVIASDQSAIAITTTQLPAALVGGRLDTNVGAWLGSTAPTVGQKLMASSVPVVLASDQTDVPIQLNQMSLAVRQSFALAGDRTVTGMVTATDRVQQIIAKFNRSLATNDLTTTTAGGATAVQNAGIVTLTSGVAVTATVRLQSNKTLVYCPGREIMMAGTWSCSATPTDIDTKVRWGQFTTTDGVWLGMDGSNGFAVATRAAAVDTVILRAAFNGDPLDGSAASQFTRLGVPEAIDFATLNIFRIRWLYYGSGPILFEVMSPDHTWVTFNTILRPNTSPTVTIETPALPVRTEIVKTASDAQSIVVTHGSWEAGTGESPSAFGLEDLRGRTYAATAVAAAADTTIYTVTTGRVLRVANMTISVDNTSAAAAGRLDIKDGGAGGTLIESVRINTLSGISFSIAYPVQKRFSTNVFADVISGTLAFTVSFTGYETIDD